MPLINDNNPDEYVKKNGYNFGKELGAGSYAKVVVTTTPQKDTVACKLICKKKAPKDFVEKFLPRELDVLKRIDHENILGSSDIFEFPTKVFIMMDLAENGDLLDYIKNKGARPNAESKKLFEDLARGMEYLHNAEIVHRDLKCENLLLFKNNKVKVADFGFARSCVDGEGKKILSQTYCGSAAYAAPEILRGSKYVPKAYDMWSVGVILFIIVCGSMPFDDSDVRRQLKRQLKNNVHFPTRVRESINEDCKKLIRQLLEVDVSRRLTIKEVRSSAWMKSN